MTYKTVPCSSSLGSFFVSEVSDGTSVTAALLISAIGTNLGFHLQNRQAEWEVRAKQWPKQPTLQIVKNTGCHLLPKGDCYRHGLQWEAISEKKRAVEFSSREDLKDSQ